MAAITSANVAQAIVKLVAAQALPALVGNLVMGNLVNRSFEPTLGIAGDTVNVPLTPSLTANNLAEGGSVTTQNPDLGNAQLVLDQHAEATFQIPDVTKIATVPDLLATYLSPAIIALAEKIETDLLALYTGFTENTATGAAATGVTEATVDATERAMFDAKVPAALQKFLVVGGAAYSDMRQISRFSEDAISSGMGLAISTGRVGQLKDFMIFRSQFIASTGGGPTVHNMAFTRNSMALVVRRLPVPLPGTGAVAEFAEMGNFGMRVVMSYQPDTLAQQFTVDTLYGIANIEARHSVEMQS